ncbi:MAG: hypothetical protein IID61_19285, partial [SAR324 cluster bacterium]|nr:hypothetical protein [SAR324 cluster bacterium]
MKLFGATKLWLPTALFGIALALAGGCVIDEDIGDAPGTTGATDGGGSTDGGGLSNVWVTKSSLPTARSGAVAAVVGGKIYVIGGQGGPLNVNEEYDPDADAWRTRSDMPTARSFPAGSASGGKNYVFGGDVGAMADNTNEEYDPVTNTWTIRTVMPTKRFGAASVEVNGKIYVLGGDDFPPSNIVEEYDPSLDEWTNCSGLPNPPCAAMPIGRFDFAAVALNGKIYVLGGDTGGGNAIST